MFKSAFEKAVHKYLNTTSRSEANRAKIEIEELVNNNVKPNTRETIREVLEEFGMGTEWLENHFTPGSLFLDRGWVFGWYSSEQMQAERLPVKLSKAYFEGNFREIEVIERCNGFLPAEPLPFVNGFPVSIPEGKSDLFARYKWAAAVPVQWHRTADGYIVDRTILACDFAVAWKWWPAAAKHYAKYPPSQLIEDFGFLSPDQNYFGDGWLAS